MLNGIEWTERNFIIPANPQLSQGRRWNSRNDGVEFLRLAGDAVVPLDDPAPGRIGNKEFHPGIERESSSVESAGDFFRQRVQSIEKRDNSKALLAAFHFRSSHLPAKNRSMPLLALP